MRRLLAAVAATLVLVLSIDAVACQSDRDCSAASRCVRTFGEPYGVCERGVVPSDAKEGRRIDEPDAPKRTEGKRCQFTDDCASGLTCVAQGDPNQRVCSR